MAAKKTKRPPLIPVPRALGGVFGLLFKSKRGRSVFWSLLLIFGFGLTIYVCWQQVSDKVLASADYRVDLEDIVITPPPSWVHSDIREAVFRELSVEGPISIMDKDITRRVKDAFALHSWVERVVCVSKHFPATLNVELEYRRPACIVAASGQWFPVDVHGYVLPWSDFSPSELEQLPQVIGIDTLPVVSGAYWNDKQVDAAARIGAVLCPVWEELGLDFIRPLQTPYNAGQTEAKNFELVTKQGTVILWGTSSNPKQPSTGSSQTLSNEEKVAKLKRYFQQHGTLDLPEGRVLDLRLSPSSVAGAI